MVTDISGKSSLAFCRDTNFRKEKRVIAWLRAGVLKLKGIRKTADKEKCPLKLGEKAFRQTLLNCLENKNWRKINK